MTNHTDENAYALSMIVWQATIAGADVPIKAIIREPFELSDDHWICATTICGLFHRKADISGYSPPTAVAAARKFLKTELDAYVMPNPGQTTTARDSQLRLWRLIDKG